MRSTFLYLIYTAILTTVPLTPTPLPAGEMAYAVKKGQSLSLICQEIYEDKDLYTLVALYNGKDDPRKIVAGEVLRMPFSDIVTLRKGESLSGLAKRTWGDAKKYPVIAWANGIRRPEVVPAGTRLMLPIMIPYRLKRGESISSVAALIYGDPKNFAPILLASAVNDPNRVPIGSLLNVPYLFPRPVVKSTLNTDKNMGSEAGSDKAMNFLKQAEASIRAGRYGEAWTAGNKAARGLKGRDKARAMRLLAASQYAFGRNEEALEDLKAAYTLDPEFRPDPAYVNPEMMELYKQAMEK
jgi:hypothetical protein